MGLKRFLILALLAGCAHGDALIGIHDELTSFGGFVSVMEAVFDSQGQLIASLYLDSTVPQVSARFAYIVPDVRPGFSDLMSFVPATVSSVQIVDTPFTDGAVWSVEHTLIAADQVEASEPETDFLCALGLFAVVVFSKLKPQQFVEPEAEPAIYELLSWDLPGRKPHFRKKRRVTL